jgi:hypothetical protein
LPACAAVLAAAPAAGLSSSRIGSGIGSLRRPQLIRCLGLQRPKLAELLLLRYQLLLLHRDLLLLC